MTGRLIIERLGPGVTLQDLGRGGGMGVGLSRGGSADRTAFLRGAALLGNSPEAAGIEMAVTGGRFRAGSPLRIALTGARMRAMLAGVPVEPEAVCRMEPGDVLDIGAAETGVYGYLHVAGGIEAETELGGRGRHRIAGLGRDLAEGDSLPIGDDTEPNAVSTRLPPDPPSSAPIRVMPGPQTGLFPDEVLRAFEATIFVRSTRGNRQGVRMDHDGAPFATGAQLNQVSDFIAEGDIQMTGDGRPFVLLAECQTMGGYPRIGTVIPADLPRVAQAVPGEKVRFRLVTLAEAEAAWQSDGSLYRSFRKARVPLVRDPRQMPDLLSYDLISGPIQPD